MSLSMITDRTATDINTSKTLRLKIQAGQTLTDSEMQAFERGACTNTMLNRIESAQKELAGLLNKYGYFVTIQNKIDWSINDIFDYSNYMRLLGNLNKLKNAFYVYSTTPETPVYMYEANRIEKILVDIESNINYMKSKFRQCGTFDCGEVNE